MAEPQAQATSADGAQAALGVAASADATLAALTTDALIELYFEAEGPAERDELFARLSARREPEVDAFFLAMLAHDDDPFLRLAAAGELLTRGVTQAQDVLLDALEAAGDDETFRAAMDALLRGLGPQAFDALVQLAQAPERDATERLLAIEGLERCDAARAAAHFAAQLAEVAEPQALDLQALEQMVGCFVRENPDLGLRAIEGLLARLPVASAGEGEAAAEVAHALRAARAVLQPPPEEGGA